MKKQKNLIFKGVGTALVTPFSNGKIDYSALDRLIEMQISDGINSIVIGGTTGEAATLSESERYSLYTHAADRIAGRTRLILGTGTNDTRAAINRTKLAKDVGADGALVVTPYYNKGTEEGIFRHYSMIADSTDIPIILYNVPSRTGVNLGLNLLSRLSEHPNIVGLKEASDSTDRLVSLSEFGDTLPIYSGNDSQIYPCLALGGAGVISVVSNIFPRATLDITESYFSGDASLSLKYQLKLLPLIKSLFIETNPTPIKFAMERLGLCSGELRLPLGEARESTKLAVSAELDRLNG